MRRPPTRVAMMAPMEHPSRENAVDLFERLLARSHLSRPSEVGDVVAEVLEQTLGASEVVLYWVNLEQTHLMPVPRRSASTGEPRDIDGSMPGRCFSSTEILTGSASRPGHRRWYVPILDGTDRIGALELELPVPDGDEAPDDLLRLLERYAHAIAQLLMTKRSYGDFLHGVQRTRTMDLSAELLWSVLPPSTFATDGLVISGILEPTYENGGDAFDYAVNEDLTHLAVFDGAGHGLGGATLSTFAVAAYRHSRRAGRGLAQTYAEVDAAIAEQFASGRFVTAVLAELEPETGLLRWVNAGHPPLLLLRQGHIVKLLATEPATPLGLPMFESRVTVAQEQLEPGDAVVLYTDGVTESRRSDGSHLGVEGLSQFLQNEAAAQQSTPETLRRLQRTLLSSAGDDLDDDATVLMVEWRSGAERRLMPQTV